MPKPAAFVTRADLISDLRRLGVRAGDTVMAHAAIRRVGRLLDGPDSLVGALCEAVGPAGTVAAYTDWEARYEELLAPDGSVPDAWRRHVPPFDAGASRAAQSNGAFAEFLRTTPGALRSGNPGASVAALGARAEWLTADHPLDFGYGAGSPLARLVEAGGKVALIGAPLDSMTLLHHAEHLAQVPDKRVKRVEVPFAGPYGTIWRWTEEFETAEVVSPNLPQDAFEQIVQAARSAGLSAEGQVGEAPALLFDARRMVEFAVAWLEATARGLTPPAAALRREP